jgi:hypothetical protein
MAWLKQEPQNFKGWFRSAQSFLKLTEYIPSTFDILCLKIYFPIRPTVFLPAAGLNTETLSF